MTEIYKSRQRAGEASEKLKIFAQPQRLMILSFLLSGESSVSEIDAATGIGQPALSQQLAALRRGEIVTTRRDGKQIWYDLADESARLCVRTLEAILTDSADAVQLLGSGTKPLRRDHDKAGAAGFATIL